MYKIDVQCTPKLWQTKLLKEMLRHASFNKQNEYQFKLQYNVRQFFSSMKSKTYKVDLLINDCVAEKK